MKSFLVDVGIYWLVTGWSPTMCVLYQGTLFNFIVCFSSVSLHWFLIITFCTATGLERIFSNDHSSYDRNCKLWSVGCTSCCTHFCMYDTGHGNYNTVRQSTIFLGYIWNESHNDVQSQWNDHRCSLVFVPNRILFVGRNVYVDIAKRSCDSMRDWFGRHTCFFFPHVLAASILVCENCQRNTQSHVQRPLTRKRWTIKQN